MNQKIRADLLKGHNKRNILLGLIIGILLILAISIIMGDKMKDKAKPLTEDEAKELVWQYLLNSTNNRIMAVGYELQPIATKVGSSWSIRFNPPGPEGEYLVDEKTGRVTRKAE